MPDTHTTTQVSEEFYVGYLPVPPGQRRFLLWLVPSAAALVSLVVALWAYSLRDPGDGRWDDANTTTISGLVLARPYPMIVSADDSGQQQVTLLVQSGKHGASARVATLDRTRCVVRGTLLGREGPRMLEILDDDQALAPAPDPANTDILESGTTEHVTLRGEIVDSKCFLGAMKPGNGKTHKACATLCVHGGIPPALAVKREDGAVDFYLLSSPDGGPVGAWVEPLIADPVELSGVLTRRADLNILRVSPQSVRRL